MKRIIAFLTATRALAASSSPLSAGKDMRPDVSKANASLHSAAKQWPASGELAGN
ncbi:MAG: hypothetical protein ABI910_10360 [Gemmatimonadota bacterium]